MKNSLLLGLALSALSLSAASDWSPIFDDKPVPEKLASQIAAALPDTPIVKPSKARRVLLFSATAGYRHRSIPTGKLAIEEMGKSSGAYETVVSDAFSNFEPEALKQFDAVILLSPTQDFFMPNSKLRKDFSKEEWSFLKQQHNRLIDNLIDYVKAGGGLMGIHAPTDACYSHQEYGEMIGGYFDGHPWRANTNVTIVVEDPEHATMAPVFGGMDDFQIKEEIYQFRESPYSREKLRILLHLDPERSESVKGKKRADNDYPVAWVQGVGEGRVFYSSLGHNHSIFSDPMLLKHFLAGIQFATGDLKADTTPSAHIAVPHVH